VQCRTGMIVGLGVGPAGALVPLLPRPRGREGLRPSSAAPSGAAARSGTESPTCTEREGRRGLLGRTVLRSFSTLWVASKSRGRPRSPPERRTRASGVQAVTIITAGR
jgi:hypothetical protein